MPDPINIDPSNLPLNAPDTNVAAPPPAPGVEKFSLGEFESYTPTGEKPVLNETGTKLAKEQPAIKKTTQPDSSTVKDTNNNVNKEVPTKVEDETPAKGEVEKGTEDNEGEEEVEENEDGGDKTDRQDKGEADKGSEESEDDEKIHGNSKRDYSGLSQNEIKVLKKLDNSRFNAIAPLIKTYKEAAAQSIKLATELESAKKMLKEGGIPETWHEHPEAYQLSKEFQDLNTMYSYQDQAESHYEQQLINIKQGKPWVALQWNKITNSFEYSQPREASDHGEMFVQKQIAAATFAKQSLTAKSEVLKQSFTQNYQKDVTYWKDEVDRLISKVHPDVKPREQDQKLIESLIPKRFVNNPLYYALVQFGGMLLAQGEKLAEKYKDQEQVTRLNQDVRKNGAAKPPGLKRPSAPAKGEGEKLSMKMFGES